MNLEMESMCSKSVWELVDPPKNIRPSGYKWIFKKNRGVDEKVESFKPRLVAKKSRLWRDFLSFGHTQAQDQEQKVRKLLKSIYKLKQASRLWNRRFDKTTKTYGFKQNIDEPYVYKLINNRSVVFLVLYSDDILLIENEIGKLFEVKNWLADQFQMKDFRAASYVLRIQIIWDRKNKLLALSQASYIDKMLARFACKISRKVSYWPDMELNYLTSSLTRLHRKKRTLDNSHMPLQLEV